MRSPPPEVVESQGHKRIVEEEEMGFNEFKSFLNFDFSAAMSTISELLLMDDKHDFCKAEAITMSIAVSIMWTSLPIAIMSHGLDLSFFRWSGSIRTLKVGNAAPPGDGFDNTRSSRDVTAIVTPYATLVRTE